MANSASLSFLLGCCGWMDYTQQQQHASAIYAPASRQEETDVLRNLKGGHTLLVRVVNLATVHEQQEVELNHAIAVTGSLLVPLENYNPLGCSPASVGFQVPVSQKQHRAHR
eukprot:5548993-Amphidinium_carterae.2